MNAADVLRVMQQAAPKIVEYLLPAGRKRGGEWCIGDLENNEGQSLRISLKTKPLVWIDHATGQGGGGLDLWMAVRCVTLPEALAEVKQFLAIRDEPGVRMLRAKTYRKPTPKVTRTDNSVVAWFAARGIVSETVRRWRVRTQYHLSADMVLFAAIPAIGLDRKTVENVKYRNLRDKHDMRQEPGCAPALVGKHLLTGNETTITITEGECDAMVLDQMGIRALSMPNGANSHEWIAYEWPLLEQFTDIVLAYDDDEAGHKGMVTAVARLGLERCRVMRYSDCKDANDWLRAGATRDDFLAAHAKAKSIDPVQLHSIAEYAERMRAYMNPDPNAPTAPLLQIDVDLDWYEIRPGEVTLWTGINGHGKSLLLSQFCLGQMRQGQSLCVYSGEMRMEGLLARMLRQASGLAHLTDAYIDAICAHYGEQFFVYESATGGTSAPLDDILAVFTYAARRYGINQFTIDSLMKTDVPEDGPRSLTAQKEAMNKIVDFAHRHNCHVHVVAHPRKDRDETNPPGKMDVSGSGKIVDQVDGVFSVWKKDDRKVEAEPDKPHGRLELLKQRDAGKPQNREVALWFDNVSLQYRTTRKLYRPQRYVEFDGAPVFVMQEPEEIDDEVPEEDRF